MMMRLTLLIALLALAVAPLAAQGSKKTLLGSYNAWDAFRADYEDGSHACFILSRPSDWRASRSNVRRGQIYLSVSHYPEQKRRNEVNVVIGYTFEDGSEVKAEIDGKTSFGLFTIGDAAWSYDDTEADAEMINAMKAGVNLVITGTSNRGTTTTDTYSLSGFTAAYNAISNAC